MADTFTCYIARTPEGEALYVGQTSDIERRKSQHVATSDWWFDGVEWESEAFDSRVDAMRREAEVIAELNPKHNKVCPRPDPENIVPWQDIQEKADAELLERLRAIEEAAKKARMAEQRRQKSKYEQRERRAKAKTPKGAQE